MCHFKVSLMSMLFRTLIVKIYVTNGFFVKHIWKALKKNKNEVTNELSHKLPPTKKIDHKIEVILEFELSSKAFYRLNKKSLLELNMQLNDLL